MSRYRIDMRITFEVIDADGEEDAHRRAENKMRDVSRREFFGKLQWDFDDRGSIIEIVAMEYDQPILSPQHEAFCRAEAERRYDGKIIRDDESGILFVEDSDGVCHTDAVLRALSFFVPPIAEKGGER
jgi:hypothetical protein